MWFDVVWYGLIWFDVVWYGLMWFEKLGQVSEFGSAELASLGSEFLRRQRQRRVIVERTVEGVARNRGTPGHPHTQNPEGVREQHHLVITFKTLIIH